MARPKMRWLAPPGWPEAPAGWSPPPGWQPDPDWPEPPDDWQWWQLEGASNEAEAEPEALPEVEFPYYTAHIRRKPQRLAAAQAILRDDERLVAAFRITKVSPAMDSLVITTERVLAGTTPGLRAGNALVQLDVYSVEAFAIRGRNKLDIESSNGATTRLGLLLDDPIETVRAALDAARSNRDRSVQSGHPPEPGDDVVQQGQTDRRGVDLSKPPMPIRVVESSARLTTAVEFESTEESRNALTRALLNGTSASLLSSLERAAEDVRDANSQLDAVIGQATEAVEAQRAALRSAREPRKLKAIGTVRRVTLFDTEVRIPGTVIPLDPRVRAWGVPFPPKGAVLTINDEHRVHTVRWDGTSSFSTTVGPAAAFGMANSIVEAAIQSDIVRWERERTCRTIELALIDECQRAQVRIAGELLTHQKALAPAEEFLASSKELAAIRGKDRARDGLIRACQKAVDGAHALALRVRELDATWATEINDRSASLERRPLPARPPSPSAPTDPPPAQTAPPPAPSPAPQPSADAASLMKTLQDLSELRDAGVLTNAEFAAKKAEILGRL